MANQREKPSIYGTLGLDVGIVGRWSRLGLGLLILVPTALALIQDYSETSISLRFVGLTIFYFVLITLAYAAVYWALGERLFATANPWINTAILVGPAIVLAWWDFTIGPLTGIRLPTGLQLAMGLYIGISFVLQWRIRYGGCEVVSIPILLFKRRYTTYCIPLVAVDALEKAIVNHGAPRGQDLTEES